MASSSIGRTGIAFIVDMRNFVRLWRDQWKLIVGVTLLACLASGTVIYLTPHRYTSGVTLYVTQQGASTDPAEAYQGALLSQQDVQSYADIINGPMLAESVIKQLGLTMTAAELEAEISAKAVPQTSLLTADVTDPTAAQAQRIANAIGTQFSRLVNVLERPAKGGTAPVRATVVARATLPSAPSAPRPVRDLVIALAAGLLAGLGLAAARRSLDTTVKTPEQLAELTQNAPLLGAVPFDPASRRSPLALRDGGPGARLEAYRKIAANLQFVDVDRPRKVLMFTSARPEEGKSSAVCNLAVQLADAGHRVIVVECDLHRPRVSNYLGLPDAAGVSDVLAGRCDLGEAIQRWGDDLFDVLASGTQAPNPSGLLGSQRMVALISRLRERYEIVLVDTPPILPFADAALTVAACDGAVLVARHGHTKTDQVRRAAAELVLVNAPVLGTVLSMTPRATHTDYGYHYSRRYSGRQNRAQVPARPQAPKQKQAQTQEATGPSDLSDWMIDPVPISGPRGRARR